MNTYAIWAMHGTYAYICKKSPWAEEKVIRQLVARCKMSEKHAGAIIGVITYVTNRVHFVMHMQPLV